MTRLLIVNADDYGLTGGVSRGILRAHRDGIVTSTSVLAVAPAFESAARALRDAAELGIGVHLAAVGEDPPLLPRAQVSSLVDETGKFPLDWRMYLRRARRIEPSELEAEFAAQIERVRGAGLAVDHLDVHQHLHLLPGSRGVVLRLARRFAIRGVRVPSASIRRPAGVFVRWLSRGLVRAVSGAGLVSPERSEGFDDAGRMDRRRLLRAIQEIGRSGARTAEILVHPGEELDPDRSRYRWGYDWPRELAALLDPEARAAVSRAGMRLATYRDLPGDRP